MSATWGGWGDDEGDDESKSGGVLGSLNPLDSLFKLGGGLIKGLFGGKARKRAAKAKQQAAQYEVDRKQKGLNRKQYNLAALHKALKREGWYGEDYMKQYGTVGPQQLRDWKYDEVPLEASPGILESMGSGLADAAGDYFSDSAAARRDAETERRRV